MPDLLTQLAQIRQQQGLDPLPDPRVIQGFEPGSPPAPPFMPSSVTQQDHFVDEIPDQEPETYQSPLVAAASPSPSAPGTAPADLIPKFELIILDSSAAYRGHDVELSREERNAIVSVVLAALRRALDALRAEVDGPPGPGLTPDEKAALQAPLEAPRKKRGRPRKVQP